MVHILEVQKEEFAKPKTSPSSGIKESVLNTMECILQKGIKREELRSGGIHISSKIEESVESGLVQKADVIAILEKHYPQSARRLFYFHKDVGVSVTEIFEHEKYIAWGILHNHFSPDELAEMNFGNGITQEEYIQKYCHEDIMNEHAEILMNPLGNPIIQELIRVERELDR